MTTFSASRDALTRGTALPCPAPTLADLLAHVQADPALTDRQRQDTASAIRTVAKALGRPPDEISAYPAELRARLEKFAPAMAGLNERRWRNALSLVRSALKAAGLASMPARAATPLAPAWTALIALFEGRHAAIPLCRLARFCSVHGVAPAAVDDAVFTAFARALTDDGLIVRPHQVVQRAAVVWNASATLPGWPGRPVGVPDRRRTVILPWSAFPASLEAEVRAYLDRLAGKDILEELDFRPLKPASLQTKLYHLRAWLAALVHRGRDPRTMTSLRDVVMVETVKDGLRFFLDRGPKGATGRAYDLLSTLIPLARHWVGLGEAEVKALRVLSKRLQPKRNGMTEENRRRLRPLDDPAKARALAMLPAKLVAEVAGTPPTRAAALVVQTALAIEILLMLPVRLKNLVHLDLERHLIRHGKRMHLAIPMDETKNDVVIEATLPAPTMQLLDLYLGRYRPLLMAEPSPWLFPGRRDGQPKCDRQLRAQIGETVKRRCGLTVNPHLFRHIAATQYLKAHPGAYGVMQLVLGHKSSNTTKTYYCGTETAAALRHFDAFVLGLRETPSSDTPEDGR